MILPGNEEHRNKLLLDGSHLKKTRTLGGAGAGVVTLGIFSIAIGVMLGAPLFAIDMAAVGLVLFGICAVIGLLFIFIGRAMYQKQIANYKKFYLKRSEYSEEELDDFDREARTGNIVLISSFKKLNKRAYQLMGFVTDHWLKPPEKLHVVFKLADIAAIWYEEKGYYNNTQLPPAVLLVRSTGEINYFSASKEVGQEVIEEVLKRNPIAIGCRRFNYEGKNYDALAQEKEVAEIYRKEFGKAMNQR